jgi:L-alanine-DL-glutamate epimerase-like enolase superfamily enzyme
MIIEEIEVFPVELLRVREFKIATGSSKTIKSVIIKISSEGKTGWGACAPNTVTRETAESILKALGPLKNSLLENELAALSEGAGMMDLALRDNPAAKAGLDIALYDLAGKIEGRQTCDVLGRVKESQLTDVSLGIDTMENTVAEARQCAEKGFKALKLKVGLDVEADIKMVGAVRDAVGSQIRLRADANQGYATDEAIKFCEEVAHLGLEFLEQPVPANDLDSMGTVREHSPIPLMADESVKSLSDLNHLVKSECADMVNIKLMKCGGITRAMEMASVCKDAGMKNMIGCMGECSISIAGALHFALASENVAYADLDSQFNLAEDVASGIEFRNGELWPSLETGLGLSINNEKISKYVL